VRIEYICHACLFIDTGDLKLVTDPWFRGSSYCGQWHLFPRPVNTGIVDDADAILLSHGHEDHFHEQSLRAMPKAAKVFYPYGWYGGATEFLQQQLGFNDVIEAHPQRQYRLTSNTTVSYVVNSLDSIMVIESDGTVVVNVNDALHSYPPKIIAMFVRALKQRWPRIDTVLCGFGGASYFPNTIHCPGKNDLEIAETREQLFAHNFCRIVHDLQPVVAIPFAADFALLGDKQRWINEVRFPRARLADYYRELYGDDGIRIEPMYSGDVLADGELIPRSPYRKQVGAHGLSHLIEEQYGPEIAEKQTIAWISEAQVESFCRRMLSNIQSRAELFGSRQLEEAKFSVKVTDVRESNFFNVSFDKREARVERASRPAGDAILVLETSSRILLHSFASDWGGDAITIGYGCEIQVSDQNTIKSGADVTCVRLLTRQPPASQHWKVEPIRVARYLISSPTTRAWAARAALNRSSEYSDKKTNDVMREWLFRSKCEVCRACDLPLLDEKFAATL
jgi:hypothetical protein